MSMPLPFKNAEEIENLQTKTNHKLKMEQQLSLAMERWFAQV